MSRRGAFTLIELLVLIALVGVLAALLLPALARARNQAYRTECSSHLRQILQAIHLYAQDHGDGLPVLPDPNPYPNGVGAYYKQLVKGYLGLTGHASPQEKVFGCPSDRTVRHQVQHAFTSYTFNGYEVGLGDPPRITGQTLASIRRPTRAVLVGEWTAFFGGSWHPVRLGNHKGQASVLAFVDGHVAVTSIYWDGVEGSRPCDYSPVAGYFYSWDGE